MFKISHHAITQNIESALMGEIFTWDLICEFYPQNFISQGFNFTNLPIEKISQVIPFFGILPKIKAFVSLEHKKINRKDLISQIQCGKQICKDLVSQILKIFAKFKKISHLKYFFTYLP